VATVPEVIGNLNGAVEGVFDFLNPVALIPNAYQMGRHAAERGGTAYAALRASGEDKASAAGGVALLMIADTVGVTKISDALNGKEAVTNRPLPPAERISTGIVGVVEVVTVADGVEILTSPKGPLGRAPVVKPGALGEGAAPRPGAGGEVPGGQPPLPAEVLPPEGAAGGEVGGNPAGGAAAGKPMVGPIVEEGLTPLTAEEVRTYSTAATPLREGEAHWVNVPGKRRQLATTLEEARAIKARLDEEVAAAAKAKAEQDAAAAKVAADQAAKRAETAKAIARGHAKEEHWVRDGKFRRAGIDTQAKWEAHVERAMELGEKKSLAGGKTAYYYNNGTVETIVIVDPANIADKGTAFAGNRARFNRLK
jgi:hypothetical protein